ncbi:MAG: hypothetical protein ACO1O1_14840 [Adhaeribacter sp.]
MRHLLTFLLEPRNRKLVLLLGLLTGVRAGLLVFNSHGLDLNPDEFGNYHIARSWVQGLGYTRFDPVTQTQKPLAFYATFPVWVYALFLKAGLNIAFWVLLVHLASLAAYVLACWYFYRSLALFIAQERLRFWGTLIFAAYPSTLFYIGSIFWYENLTMPVLVYVSYHLLRLLQGGRLERRHWLLIPLLISGSCLFRGQLLFIYFFLFICFLVLGRHIILQGKGRQLLALPLLVAGLLVFSHVPILVKNYRLFGGLLLSTQPGFELLQGHNPYADGRWTMAWTDPGEPLYDYAAARIPGLKYLDQYTESRERARLAWEWIRQHPRAELQLLARKVGVFFRPDNSPYFEGNTLPGFPWWNPLNGAVHALFLLALAAAGLRPRRFGLRGSERFLLAPVGAVLLLSLIFFVGHRWRFYAEPYMLLTGFLFLSKFPSFGSWLKNP